MHHQGRSSRAHIEDKHVLLLIPIRYDNIVILNLRISVYQRRSQRQVLLQLLTVKASF